MTHLDNIRRTLEKTDSGRRALAVCEAARKYMSALDAQTDPARRCEQTYRDMGVLCTQLDIAVRALLAEASDEQVIATTHQPQVVLISRPPEVPAFTAADILRGLRAQRDDRPEISVTVLPDNRYRVLPAEAPEERPAGGEGGAE